MTTPDERDTGWHRHPKHVVQDRGCHRSCVYRDRPVLVISPAALAAQVDAARAEALREAADVLRDRWVKEGRHYGQPGCYSSGYEHWLRARADEIEAAR